MGRRRPIQRFVGKKGLDPLYYKKESRLKIARGRARPPPSRVRIVSLIGADGAKEVKVFCRAFTENVFHHTVSEQGGKTMKGEGRTEP